MKQKIFKLGFYWIVTRPGVPNRVYHEFSEAVYGAELERMRFNNDWKA